MSALRTKWILLEIDKFYISHKINEVSVTSVIISMWRKTRQNDSERTLYAKYSVWSQLTKFICRQGIECYIPSLPNHRNIKTGFTPYIFTHEQMNHIMDKSSQLRLYDRHMTCSMMIIPAIIRLLYSTGLRISEALSIKNGDVHLTENYTSHGMVLCIG
jgi:integrase